MSSLAQRATKELMKVVNKRDKNTRGLAKVVSAEAALMDSCGSLEAIEILRACRNFLIQERRELGAALLTELDIQKYGKGL